MSEQDISELKALEQRLRKDKAFIELELETIQRKYGTLQEFLADHRNKINALRSIHSRVQETGKYGRNREEAQHRLDQISPRIGKDDLKWRGINEAVEALNKEAAASELGLIRTRSELAAVRNHIRILETSSYFEQSDSEADPVDFCTPLRNMVPNLSRNHFTPESIYVNLESCPIQGNSSAAQQNVGARKRLDFEQLSNTILEEEERNRPEDNETVTVQMELVSETTSAKDSKGSYQFVSCRPRPWCSRYAGVLLVLILLATVLISIPFWPLADGLKIFYSATTTNRTMVDGIAASRLTLPFVTSTSVYG